jgi:leucyl-tRNA synthetase
VSPAEVASAERRANGKAVAERCACRDRPIEKMSKSKKNVVDPDEIVSTYGADTARWFMLSDSPPERDVQWTDAIAGMASDIEALHFNKAVARTHELVNAIEKAAPSASRDAAIRTLPRLISPMLPHLAEEGWAALGGEGLVSSQPWPDHDPALLVDDEVTIAVQVNGKLRDTLTVPKDLDKAGLEALALASDKIIRTLDGATPKKVIVVPGRLVNIVA